MTAIHPTREIAVRGWMIAGSSTLYCTGSHGQFDPGRRLAG